MNATECIKSRASVRAFKPDKVPERLVSEILEAATCAPSAGNVQDWEFVLVTRKETRDKLAEAAWGQDFLSGAPMIVVFCSNMRAISSSYGERGASLYSIQDTAAAALSMMLAAWDRGLGTCWVGSFNEEKVRQALVLPSEVRPLAMVPVGYPSSKPQKPPRKAVAEVLHREYY